MYQRIRLLISYKGLKYYGWQKQKNLPSVQGKIEQVLTFFFKKKIRLIGAGRTDTGAHAIGQNAHFDLPSGLLSPNYSLTKALNSLLLKEDICIRRAWKTNQDFHSLHSATEKYYIYFILNRPRPCVFRKGLIYWYPYPCDLVTLKALSQQIKGEHDFKSFQNRGTTVKSTVRKIKKAEWRQSQKGNLLSFHIQGEGFLKQMIRNLVGTQLEILRTKKPHQEWQTILSAKDRKRAYKTAPASGLYLYKVSYPPELDRKCEKI